MSKKKISIPVFLVVCAVLVVITFQITFLAVTQMFRNKIVNETSDNTKATWESKLEYIEELTKKYFLKPLSHLYLFRLYNLQKIFKIVQVQNKKTPAEPKSHGRKILLD